VTLKHKNEEIVLKKERVTNILYYTNLKLQKNFNNEEIIEKSEPINHSKKKKFVKSKINIYYTKTCTKRQSKRRPLEEINLTFVETFAFSKQLVLVLSCRWCSGAVTGVSCRGNPLTFLGNCGSCSLSLGHDEVGVSSSGTPLVDTLVAPSSACNHNRHTDKSTFIFHSLDIFITFKTAVFVYVLSFALGLMLLALSGDVHSNPGPKTFHVHNKSNLVIMTYNVQGLKNFKKLKRVNNFLHKLPFNKNVIINLQETHLSKCEINKLNYQWKWGSCHSATENNSGGTSILYNKNYFDEIIKTKTDTIQR